MESMKTYVWGGTAPLIRKLGRKCREGSDSCLSRFTLGRTDTANPSIEVWMGIKSDLEVLKKREFSFLARAGMEPPFLHQLCNE